jgi:CubicO group peptidase (beta-lactamase class C family)
MAKSIVSIAVGMALAEGKIASLDDAVSKYAPKLAGSPYGETSIRNVLKMSSGVPFNEVYDGKDDLTRFSIMRRSQGSIAALRSFGGREVEQGTRFHYAQNGEVAAIIRASAGWGKITVLEEIRATLGMSHDHIVYMGDGSSDLPVMMHVNSYDGLTIAVSEAEFITRVAKRTVLSDNAMSVLVPVMEEVLRWDSARIRRFFASQGLMLREWGKSRTDQLLIQESSEPIPMDQHVTSPPVIAQRA